MNELRNIRDIQKEIDEAREAFHALEARCKAEIALVRQSRGQKPKDYSQAEWIDFGRDAVRTRG